MTIGRLSPEKDQEKLLFAFKEIMMQSNDQHQLYIIGSGKEEKKLKTTAYVLGLEKCYFCRATSHAMEMLDKCDLFVFPSKSRRATNDFARMSSTSNSGCCNGHSRKYSVLEDQNGMIVDNSVEGLVGGMNRYLAGEKILHH